SPELLDQPRAWPALALAHHQLGQADEAKKWLAKADEWHDKAVRDALDSPDFRVITSDTWEHAQFLALYREAKMLIEGAAPKEDDFKAYQKRARDWLRQLDRATAEYDVALALSPKSTRPWLARARLFAGRRDWEKADADLERAVAINRDDAQVWKE